MTPLLGSKKIEFGIRNHTPLRTYCFYPLLLLLAISFVSCSSPKSAPAESESTISRSEEAPPENKAIPEPVPISTVEPTQMASPVIASIPDNVAFKLPITTQSLTNKSYQKYTHTQETATTKSTQSKDSKANKFDEYRVVLAADKQMKIPGLPGELRVWIGNPNYQPIIPDDMAEANTTLPAALGGWAKIEPHAPAFTLEPPATPCVKIDPSGSEVRFNLIPQKAGTFKVGASVWLFKSPNCEDSPVPKAAADLYVTVKVDKKVIVKEKGKELWTIFWEQLLEFWKAFLILLFGLILFLIRGKLKRWFGYEKN